MELEEEVFASNNYSLPGVVGAVVEVRTYEIIPKCDCVWVDDSIVLDWRKKVRLDFFALRDVHALTSVIFPEWVELEPIASLSTATLQPKIRLLHHEDYQAIFPSMLQSTLIDTVLPQGTLFTRVPIIY